VCACGLYQLLKYALQMLISTVETSFLGNRKKPILFKMFEEIAVEAARMLTLFFWGMIASIIVLGWMPYKRR
jgi:hypothetical protein